MPEVEINVRILQTPKKYWQTIIIFFVDKEDLFFNTKLIGTEGTRLLREMRGMGDPAGARRRGGSLTARGKRVPGVEINERCFHSFSHKKKSV